MGVERDEYFVAERVVFDADVLLPTGFPAPSPPGLDGTTVTLTILPPPDGAAARDDVDIDLDVNGIHVRGVYDTEFAGWHEWRLVTSGAIRSAMQGRFRVLPVNV